MFPLRTANRAILPVLWLLAAFGEARIGHLPGFALGKDRVQRGDSTRLDAGVGCNRTPGMRKEAMGFVATGGEMSRRSEPTWTMTAEVFTAAGSFVA